MACYPSLVTGGRKIPVSRSFNVLAVSFGPFRAYPYVVRRRRSGFVYHGGMGSHLDIDMLG